jgi:hypothetical protein
VCGCKPYFRCVCLHSYECRIVGSTVGVFTTVMGPLLPSASCKRLEKGNGFTAAASAIDYHHDLTNVYTATAGLIPVTNIRFKLRNRVVLTGRD